jgi:hypothetical protein
MTAKSAIEGGEATGSLIFSVKVIADDPACFGEAIVTS